MVLSAFLGCTTVAKDLPSREPSVDAVLVSSAELRAKFGRTFAENPYMPAVPFFSRSREEFVVVRLDLYVPDNMTLSVTARVRSPDDVDLAKQEDLDGMRSYWDLYRGTDARQVQKRLSALQRSYLPSNPFELRAGSRTYYLVLSGKNPIPRPAIVNVLVALGGEIKAFEFALPEPVSTK